MNLIDHFNIAGGGSPIERVHFSILDSPMLEGERNTRRDEGESKTGCATNQALDVL
jgi:hypothetical protein